LNLFFLVLIRIVPLTQLKRTVEKIGISRFAREFGKRAERKNDVAALLRLKQEKLELDRKLAGF